jgi:hypothetical protein
VRVALLASLGFAVLLAPALARADEPPPAHRWFQLAMRTGAAIPFGDVNKATKMSDALTVQLPFIVDVGVKPLAPLFIGVYLGAAVGGAAGVVEQQCNGVGLSCTGVGFRGGLSVQYNFLPAARINPWIGYGIGYEIGGSNGSSGDRSVSNSYRGFEFAHILGGADVRLTEYFGIGPFLDVAIGQYDVAKSEVNNGGRVQTLGGIIPDKSPHAWFIVGVRATMFP